MSKDDGSLRDDEVLSVAISKDEMNLAEFPFTLLSRRAETGRKTIEVSQHIRDQGGRIIKQEWVVTGGDKYGLPLAIDEDVYVALMHLYKENDFKDRRMHFSRYQMLSIMGKETSKRGYDRIEEALNRLVSVTIVSKNAFWDNDARMYVSRAFHLFDSYSLYDERVSGENQQSLPLSNIVMSEFLFDSIEAGYIKNLDVKFYFSLETPLSKRLYRYLDKKKYRKRSFEIGLLKLAALLPIRDQYPSQIKRRLDRSHTELIEKGFLGSVSYEQGKEEKVVYSFPGARSQTVESLGRSAYQSDENAAVMLKQLEQRGISGGTARSLVEHYPTDRVRKHIEVFDWLKERESLLIGKNPAGFLRKSIEEDYQPPEDYLSHREREERGQEERDRRERWLQHREELIGQDIANWDRTPPGERVKGVLEFWVAGQKLSGSTPTPEQIEVRKQELIDNLPKTEEAKREYVARSYPEEPPAEFE